MVTYHFLFVTYILQSQVTAIQIDLGKLIQNLTSSMGQGSEIVGLFHKYIGIDTLKKFNPKRLPRSLLDMVVNVYQKGGRAEMKSLGDKYDRMLERIRQRKGKSPKEIDVIREMEELETEESADDSDSEEDSDLE